MKYTVELKSPENRFRASHFVAFPIPNSEKGILVDPTQETASVSARRRALCGAGAEIHLRAIEINNWAESVKKLYESAPADNRIAREIIEAAQSLCASSFQTMVDSMALTQAFNPQAFDLLDEFVEKETLHVPAYGRSWNVEELHEHEFTVSARLSGPLDESDVVVDFLKAHSALKEVLQRWDGRVLLARNAPYATYRSNEDDGVTEIVLADRPSSPLVIPDAQIRWLSGVNASAEIIAGALLDEWVQTLDIPNFDEQYRATLRVEEAPGAFAEASTHQRD